MRCLGSLAGAGLSGWLRSLLKWLLLRTDLGGVEPCRLFLEGGDQHFRQVGALAVLNEVRIIVHALGAVAVEASDPSDGALDLLPVVADQQNRIQPFQSHKFHRVATGGGGVVSEDGLKLRGDVGGIAVGKSHDAGGLLFHPVDIEGHHYVDQRPALGGGTAQQN